MSTTQSIVEALPKLVDVLSPLSPENRQRAISAALVVLGGSSESEIHSAKQIETTSLLQSSAMSQSELHPKAQAWLNKNRVTHEILEQVFAIDGQGVDVIAARMPGKSKRRQTVEAYVISGVASFLKSGEPNFTNIDARKLCQKIGAYDAPNHSNYLKAFGNLIHGSKESGWKLTNPGLNEGVQILREIAGETND